jgi:hypothetical protein
LALAVAATGTAAAATGGAILLGRANSAANRTVVTNTGGGPALQLKVTKPHTPALSVSGNKTKIASLNADLLDGLDSKRFQRTVAKRCSASGAITAIDRSGVVHCGPRVYWAVVNGNGLLVRGTKGTKVAKIAGSGLYQVSFGTSLLHCSYVATVGDPGTNASLLGFATTATRVKMNSAVFVETWNTSFHSADLSFHLVVACAPH